MVAPADASMIFSGGKTCRKLRALLPNMKDDRSSLSAGASSREWCVRQTRKKNTRCVRGRMRPGAPGARRDGAVRARRIPRAATSARFRGTVRTKSPLACAMRARGRPVFAPRRPAFARAPARRPAVARPRPPDRDHAPSFHVNSQASLQQREAGPAVGAARGRSHQARGLPPRRRARPRRPPLQPQRDDPGGSLRRGGRDERPRRHHGRIHLLPERGVALPATHAEGRRVRVVAGSPVRRRGDALGVRPGDGDWVQQARRRGGDEVGDEATGTGSSRERKGHRIDPRSDR